ncbi:MAG: hypothetical protein IT350_11640 [Deltaproteobacteria bacterium]|nr:hypothetical protein [Deltaproteobacteria bacterium]
MSRAPRAENPSPKFARVLTWMFVGAFALMLPAEFANLHESGVMSRAAILLATAGRAGFAAVAAGYLVFRVLDIRAHRTWRDFGAWSALPTIAVVGWGVFAFTTIPVRAHKSRAPEAAQVAHQAGARAERAQDAFRAKHGRFADRLVDLLEIDPSIAPESDVTFRFSAMNGSGYAFSTRAPGSTVTYRFTSRKRDLERLRDERRRRVGTPNDSP